MEHQKDLIQIGKDKYHPLEQDSIDVIEASVENIKVNSKC